jgi:hypothetical protein
MASLQYILNDDRPTTTKLEGDAWTACRDLMPAMTKKVAENTRLAIEAAFYYLEVDEEIDWIDIPKYFGKSNSVRKIIREKLLDSGLWYGALGGVLTERGLDKKFKRKLSLPQKKNRKGKASEELGAEVSSEASSEGG